MTSYNVQLSLLRKKRNLSLKEAAKQIGISRFVLYLYENGYFRPSKAALKNIEEFYQEKISFEGESAYPAPLKEKAIKEKKESFLVKRIVFGTLSLFTLLSVITGIILFNKSVNNKTSYYGETYNEMQAKVEDHGEVGHDLVTALTYYYIDSYDAPNYASIIYYQTNNILYFNEAIYSTTTLTEDYGVVRYHFKFGSNLSVNSNVCEFHFGSWSHGIYATCNFTYTGEKIDKVDNYNLQLAASEKIEEQEVVDIINSKIDEVEQAFSTILSAELEKDTSFYHDFLPAREKGRIVNFALQIAALLLILPGVVAFFIFFGLFVKAMIANIKPRLVTAETNKGLNKSETLPKDLRINFGIPDMFIIIISKFLQYGSIIIMLLSIIGKVGLPLPAFMSNANFISFLRIAFLKTGLAEKGSLLVTGRTGDHDRRTEELRVRFAVNAARRLHLREHGHRNIEDAAKLLIPLKRVDVEEKGTGRVGIVGDMDAALGQLVDEPAVNGTEAQLTFFRAGASAFDVVKDPADLGAGEIGVEFQTGLFLEQIDDPGVFAFHFLREISGAAALPDDRVADGLAGLAVPDNDRLALVGDADRRDILGFGIGKAHRLARNGKLRLPDLVRVMLDPAGLREILREFLLSDGTHFAFLVEKNTTVASRSGIQCHDVLHGEFSFRMNHVLVVLLYNLISSSSSVSSLSRSHRRRLASLQLSAKRFIIRMKSFSASGPISSSVSKIGFQVRAAVWL